MKVLTCTKPGLLTYSEQYMPVSKKDHAIIKIKRIGICGTDLHAFGGNQPYFNYPRVLGHELAGELIDADNAPGFQVGEAVTIIPYFNCGHCLPCRNGKPNHCVNIQVCGVHIDGGMVQYLSVPSHALVHGRNLSLDHLALVEPLAIGAHGINRAAVQKNEWVLVMGAGPIGLGTMEFARIAGAKVIAMDISDSKLQFCKDYLQVNHVVNATSADVVGQLQHITNGDMPTVVIDATGNLSAIDNGFKYMSHGARYVLIGLQKGDINFSHPEFHKREGTLMSSRNALRSDFDHVMNALELGLVDPLTYITHRVKFNEVKDAFESWTKPETGVIKAMVTVD
ncbi:zinc-binding alcohol dehydrogenase family protein [Mucilaginibacter sp. FT3.2]|uniref:zinc-binding alcohol dehydrogenase family protein n=1 Tax=Mucilaginibacter sp. FT3.2 TaxID=2723090 RepID=UPI001609585B|nr:zinc-binding alcohol dehydrogenase family protein [Mucilaginibacter sp. FT3.2]MBB6230387.1 2-desacetyl-2-hydroxyethyl bacteriochlorophyllide A dehydrogenase [Mucilaginibacter sp. FT3.2]